MDRPGRALLFYLAVSLLVLGYVVLRAIQVGATYDEVWTLKAFVPLKAIHILNFTPPDANNHILNTFLIKWLFASGFQALPIARIPNVLACCLYLWFAARICRVHLSGLTAAGCFLLLVLNPFLLDFFSLARGYGLALGFQMASIFYLLTYSKSYASRDAMAALALGALAVLSSLSMLNYCTVLGFLVIALPILNKQVKFRWGIVLLVGIFSLILTSILYEPVRKMMALDKMTYGGDTGFYSDTLVSLAKYSHYSPEATTGTFIALNIFLSLLAIAVLASLYLNRNLFNGRSIVLGLGILCTAAVIVQFHLLGTLYLIDRTALFFYPIAILVMCFSLEAIPRKWITWPVTLGLVAAFAFNFASHANTYKTAIWDFDAQSVQILHSLNETGQAEGRVLKLDFTWPFQYSIRYYHSPAKYPFVDVVQVIDSRQSTHPEAEYYIYLGRSLEKVGYNADRQNVLQLPRDTFAHYPNEAIVVFALHPVN